MTLRSMLRQRTRYRQSPTANAPRLGLLRHRDFIVTLSGMNIARFVFGPASAR